MNKRFVLGLTIGLCLLVSAWGTPALSGSKVYKWRLQHDAPRGDILTELLTHFAKDVEQRSNGRLLIEVFADPEIVPGFELLQGVMAGTLEMANTSGLFQSGQIPLSAIEFGLPMMYKFKTEGDLVRQADEIRKFYYESGIVDLLRKEYAKFGVYWLDMHSYGPDAFFSKKPVTSLKNMKGLKIAIVPQFISWIEKMGATSAELVGGDLYMGLKLGTVDAGTWDINGVTALKFYEVGPNVIVGYSNDHMIGHFEVNLNAWNSLPKDLQKVLTEATAAWWTYKNRALAKIVEQSKSMGVKGDFKLQTPDAELSARMVELAYEVWDEWAKRDKSCEKAVALQKEWFKKRK